jgi:hypothetical protein
LPEVFRRAGIRATKRTQVREAELSRSRLLTCSTRRFQNILGHEQSKTGSEGGGEEDSSSDQGSPDEERPERRAQCKVETNRRFAEQLTN